jgi:hypothetical protein
MSGVTFGATNICTFCHDGSRCFEDATNHRRPRVIDFDAEIANGALDFRMPGHYVFM